MNTLCSVIGAAVYVLTAIGLYLALTQLAAHWNRIQDVKWRWGAERFEIGVWSALCAIPWSLILVLEVVVPLVARINTREFRVVGANVMGYDVTRASRLCFYPFAILFLLPSALRMNQYTAFTSDAVVRSDFFPPGRVTQRPYSTISAIYSIDYTKGRWDELYRPYYAIVFSDGAIWRTSDQMRAPRPAADQGIMEFLSEQSGVPIEYARTIEDLRPPQKPR